MSLNPFDEIALEAAAKLKEAKLAQRVVSASIVYNKYRNNMRAQQFHTYCAIVWSRHGIPDKYAV